MERKLKQQGIASFEGLSIGKNKTIQVKFKLRYDEILTSVELLQGLNNDITLHAKVPDKKPMNLGIFTIGAINFDKDGNATIPFKSLTDNVNVESICSLVDEELIQLRFQAIIELPDTSVEESEGGAEEWDD
jgi:hypothetical protein|nr:MAG TPA: hypothetical protein [Bacteriophage sp.]DAZ78478.1 MAG TPA: hypothetical protein [Caudoviricetes sp.]